MMSPEEARNRQLVQWLVQSAKQIDAERQRQRREEEEARREQDEAERLRAERARLRRLAIEQEARRRIEEERLQQEKIENAKRDLEERVTKAAADLQRKRTQYLVDRMTAPSELDSQCRNLDRDLDEEIAQIKDRDMRARLEPMKGEALRIMREMKKRPLEEKLKRQALECLLPYRSPF